MQLSKALIKEKMAHGGFIHQIQLYPDEDHSLSNVQAHVYQTIEAFLDHCFYHNRGVTTKYIQKSKFDKPKSKT